MTLTLYRMFIQKVFLDLCAEIAAKYDTNNNDVIQNITQQYLQRQAIFEAEMRRLLQNRSDSLRQSKHQQCLFAVFTFLAK